MLPSSTGQAVAHSEQKADHTAVPGAWRSWARAPGQILRPPAKAA